jgi:putative restriction endonuclease
MKEGQKLWTRDELILAINLYCKLPFGRLHQGNPDVIKLSKLIGRTPGSVAFKLVNFASLDPSLKAIGIKGAVNASRLDKEIWDDFFNHWDILPYESEKLLAKYKSETVEELNELSEDDLPKDGLVREQIVKVRVNQAFFRKTILAAYDCTCCITGLKNPELLIAGHIRPWGIDESNRMNPRNGLAINSLHDKAFEAGLITITPDYIIRVSSILDKKDEAVKDLFLKYDGERIITPKRFLPDVEFLKYHNTERFKL